MQNWTNLLTYKKTYQKPFVAKKPKTFTLKINHRLVPAKYNGGAGYKNGYSCKIPDQLTQQADLCLGKNKWYAKHFQALEKENGDLVFKMKAVKAKVKNYA